VLTAGEHFPERAGARRRLQQPGGQLPGAGREPGVGRGRADRVAPLRKGILRRAERPGAHHRDQPARVNIPRIPVIARPRSLAATERDGKEEPAAVGIPGHHGIAGHPAILLVRSEDRGRKAGIRERLRRRGEAGSGGLPGELDIGEVGDGLMLRRDARQAPQERSQRAPVVCPERDRHLQPGSGLLDECAQPLGRRQPRVPGIQPGVELVPDCRAGPGLDVHGPFRHRLVKEALDDAVMGLRPPWHGGRPASEPAGQVAERPPVLNAELPRPGRRVRPARLHRVPARQLLLTTLGIATEALASIALLGGHGRERSGSRHAPEAIPRRSTRTPGPSSCWLALAVAVPEGPSALSA
jgi:hypothetical protein